VICISENTSVTRTTYIMKKAACMLATTFPTDCAAPPPVKIASHLIRRSLLKKAKDEAQTSKTAQSTAPQQ